MTSIFKTPHGEMSQFIQNLHSAGFTHEDVMLIIKEPKLAEQMLASCQSRRRRVEPFWWRTAEQQLEKAQQLWPSVSLPKPPISFTRATKSEVLLLHVPDTFDSLWDKVVAPEGYTKFRWDQVKTDGEHLRLAPNKRAFTEPVWLAFDPNHGQNQSPESLWGKANLAASEVLSALIQFPEWCLSWFDSSPAPHLTGYQIKYEEEKWLVPHLRPMDEDCRLMLSINWVKYHRRYIASPSVREC